MLLHGLCRGGPQFEGEHPGTMRLIHNCFSDPCNATISAAGYQQSMKFIICLGPGKEIVVLQDGGRLYRPNQYRIRRTNDEQGSGVDPGDVWL
jgi:hypothetical protein